MANSMMQAPPGSRQSRLALLGLVLALVSALVAILSGFGSRWGWWPFGVGFTLLKWAVYVALAGVVISLIDLVRARGLGRGYAVAGFMIALVVVLLPLNYLRLARSVPPIHDITTDTDNPPGFVAILPLRKNAANSADYAGPALAAQQLKAYPEIKPMVLEVTADQAFQQALTAAREMGWAIIAENPDEGRIEATDTTTWFGFKDDIVIRVTPAGQGSRVDVRSVSRVGVSDVGTNARRITAYLKKLAASRR